MKKILLLAFAIIVGMSLNAQILSEDFDAVTPDSDVALTGWINLNQSGAHTWQGKEYSGNKYAQCSAYNGDSIEIDILVTPTLDLTNYTNLTLTFDSKDGYNNGDPLTVLISQDFNGTNYATATWMPLTASLSTGNSSGYAPSFISTGAISIDNYASATTTIAFAYSGGTLSGVTTTMQIDNVVIDGISSINENYTKNTNSIYPNPANDVICINNASTLQKVDIIDITGKIVKSIENNMSKINISELTEGVYFVRLTDENGAVHTSKVLKN